ncbi:hypothetical protein UlMin_005152 [Ulmus minor]
MEEIMMNKKQTTHFSSQQALSIHKDSQIISKTKPKIRIIHIFAPEIIKTDVANFRELVQRLTGKPTEKDCKRKPRIPRRSSSEEKPKGGSFSEKPIVTKKIDMKFSGFRNLEARDLVKEEEGGIWINNGENNNSGGFLERFADLEGFIEELGDFPLLPALLNPFDASHVHGFGGPQLT